MLHGKSLRVTLNWDPKLLLPDIIYGAFRKVFRRDVLSLGIIQPLQRH